MYEGKNAHVHAFSQVLSHNTLTLSKKRTCYDLRSYLFPRARGKCDPRAIGWCVAHMETSWGLCPWMRDRAIYACTHGPNTVHMDRIPCRRHHGIMTVHSLVSRRFVYQLKRQLRQFAFSSYVGR